MFDDNHMEESDLLIRSILENGQEEVPAHVWDGVAGGLDRVARRRTVVLWLGRAVSASAVAAAVVAGIFFSGRSHDNVPPASSGDMIAVVETPSEGQEAPVLLANVEKEQSVSKSEAMEHISMKSASEDETEAVPASETEMDADRAGEVVETAPVAEETPSAEHPDMTGSAGLGEDIPETGNDIIVDDTDWEEENEKRTGKVRASLVVSGIAGTNNPHNKGSIGPLRSPGILTTPSKTTVERTSKQTTYGIPLSFGLGVRLNFTERWSLGMGLNYTYLTSKFNGKYTEVEDGVALLPITANIRNSQHYIGIPVNAYYNIVSKDFIKFYAYAGGTVEKCMADRYEVQTAPVIHHQEAVKGVQLSANAGIGVEFLLGRYVGIYIDPSVRYYFNCKQPNSIRTAQPLMLGFEMGLRFNL